MTLETELKDFIASDLSRDLDRDLRADEDLIELGVIDSIGLMQILQFVEERTGLQIPGDRVTPENFSTVEDICALVAELREAP